MPCACISYKLTNKFSASGCRVAPRNCNDFIKATFGRIYAEITAIKEKITDMKVKNCHLQKEVSKLKVENCHLQKEVSKLKVENCHVQKEVSKLKVENCHLQKEVSKLKVENCHLQKEVSKTESGKLSSTKGSQ